MSKPFDYSKWDNIELSDDEDDVHPNIDRESWFRMKHRSRVEREENEEKDKKKIMEQMEKDQQRIKILKHDMAKLSMRPKDEELDDSDDDDDDLDERVPLQAELDELEKRNAERQARLDQYEKEKKWNIDNMFTVKDERTEINPEAGKETYTPSGFVAPEKDLKKIPIAEPPPPQAKPKPDSDEPKKDEAAKPAAVPDSKPKATTSAPPVAGPQPPAAKRNIAPTKPKSADVGSFETYPEFTEKYAGIMEEFMAIPDLAGSKAFLLQHAEVLLQENCSNYLLLASLEDEMNGQREKMKHTARQSQIISNIAELAKTLHTHPGNCIIPFFTRLEQRGPLEEFIAGVNAFVDKIIKRAVVKKAEIDAERAKEEGGKDLADIPKEERLGPGGLDPLEVIETLPPEMVAAFESRDVDELREVLLKMDPKEAEEHMKRCIDSGLWVANA